MIPRVNPPQVQPKAPARRGKAGRVAQRKKQPAKQSRRQHPYFGSREVKSKGKSRKPPKPVLYIR